MTTKKDDISRRSVLGGTLAALATSHAVASAATPASDDSAIFALCEECRQEIERLQAAYRQLDEADEIYRKLEIEGAGRDWDSGIGPYHKRVCEISARVHKLEARIAAIRAKTPDGMRAKIRALTPNPSAIRSIDDFELVLEERLPAAHLVGLSLILDVMHMSENRA